MKLKAAITEGAPDALFVDFGSTQFALGFMAILREHFGIVDPDKRPAEYYVQIPDRTIPMSRTHGVEVRLTGVSRGDREPKVFHDALAELRKLAIETVRQALTVAKSDEEVQVFVAIMIDGDVPGRPAIGGYGSILESDPVWVDRDGPTHH